MRGRLLSLRTGTGGGRALLFLLALLAPASGQELPLAEVAVQEGVRRLHLLVGPWLGPARPAPRWQLVAVPAETSSASPAHFHPASQQIRFDPAAGLLPLCHEGVHAAFASYHRHSETRARSFLVEEGLATALTAAHPGAWTRAPAEGLLAPLRGEGAAAALGRRRVLDANPLTVQALPASDRAAAYARAALWIRVLAALEDTETGPLPRLLRAATGPVGQGPRRLLLDALALSRDEAEALFADAEERLLRLPATPGRERDAAFGWHVKALQGRWQAQRREGAWPPAGW